VALEGALKLKEISYIHAEGYPAGEMKHGPIALNNEEMPVVVLNPHDAVFQKTLSNLREVEARAVERAIEDVLRAGTRTVDLAARGEKAVGTREMAEAIAARVAPAA
jgi:glucosamine 6-phosphate synthetase-like amidotransferase/phosphosugar isomerase protein